MSTINKIRMCYNEGVLGDVIRNKLGIRDRNEYYTSLLFSLRGRGNYNQIVHTINKYLGKELRKDTNSNAISSLFAVSMISMKKKDWSHTIETKNRIEKLLSNTDSERYSLQIWDRLVRLCIVNGFLVGSSICRNKYIERLVNDRSCRYIQKRFAVLFENGDYEEAIRFCQKNNMILSKLYSDQRVQLQIDICKRLLHREDIDCINLDRCFCDFIGGKRIVVVAPGYCSDYEELKNKIEKDDVIAVISNMFYDGQRSITDILHPSIDYINIGTAKKFEKQLAEIADDDSGISMPKGIKYIVLKAPQENMSCERIRVMSISYCSGYFTPYGDLNMVPLIVLDSLCNGIRVKVINANLYLSRHQYLEEMNRCFDFDNLMKMFIGHNPICNYRILHSMYKKELFEVDDDLERVLDLGEDKYIEDLEKLYLNICFDK